MLRPLTIDPVLLYYYCHMKTCPFVLFFLVFDLVFTVNVDTYLTLMKRIKSLVSAISQQCMVRVQHLHKIAHSTKSISLFYHCMYQKYSLAESCILLEAN